LLCLVALPFQSRAEIPAGVSAGGLGTRVNGSIFGRCTAGSCAVSGGTRSGSNLFQRFSQFSATGGISNVRVDTQGLGNVFLAVSGREGTLLNKPLLLSGQANLYLLSPAGLRLGPGARFENASTLLLTTSTGIALGRQRFDALSTTTAQAAGLASAPALEAESLLSPAGTVAALDLQGQGPIEIAGGLITVARDLLIDATGGPLHIGGEIGGDNGHEAQLEAGRSVHLAGRQLSLKGVGIRAGGPEGSGLLDLRTAIGPDGDQGKIQIEGLRGQARQILITGGAVSLERSRLEAPKGWIQLQSTNGPDRPNGLRVVNSQLNAGVGRLSRADEAVRFPVPDQDGNLVEVDNPAPHIGLIASGDLQLENSRLDASLDLRALGGSGQEEPVNWPQGGGILLLEAGGRLSLESSQLAADASHGFAGQIVMNGNNLRLLDSSLTANGGMGFGNLLLESSGGIEISRSDLQARSDRYPVFEGQSQVDGLPWAFLGSWIRLSNHSESQPIVITASRLIANQTTSGGGLSSSYFSVDSLYGFNIGFYKGAVAFIGGYSYGNTTPLIQAYSTAGIQLQGSRVEASSREGSGAPPENRAGLVSLINGSGQPLEILASSIDTATAAAAEPSDLDHQSGLIFAYSDSTIRISDSKFDASNGSPLALPIWQLPSVISIVSTEGSIDWQGSNRLDALHPASPAESAFRKVFDADGYPIEYDVRGVNLHPTLPTAAQAAVTPAPVSEPDPDKPTELIRDFNRNTAIYRVELDQRYAGGQGLQPARAIPAALASQPPLNPLNQLLAPTAAPTSQASQVLVEADSASQFQEAQRRALSDTVQRLGLPPGSGRLWSLPQLQAKLRQVSQSHQSSQSRYAPAILQLQRQQIAPGVSQLTAILLTPTGEPISRSRSIATAEFTALVRRFRDQIRRQEPLGADASDPGRRLAALLLDPLGPDLEATGINALLIQADRGLQSIPYAALPLTDQRLAQRFALTLTPSLGLLDLAELPAAREGSPMLLAGASTFQQKLSPLPMVRQELQVLAVDHPSTLLIDGAFEPPELLRQASFPRYRQLHIATHAEFSPGTVGAGRLYTSTGQISLGDLGRSLRSRPTGSPLDLITLSACDTALGDEQSELGFAGMALQAGARSGLGTLWKVDDGAAASFFIQYYRFLRQGLTKDQALQATQQAFLNGSVRLEGSRLVGPPVALGTTRSQLLEGIAAGQRPRYDQGLSHPYFWAGMVLTGSPW
jgi:filamentous hemagglutinin family protein